MKCQDVLPVTVAQVHRLMDSSLLRGDESKQIFTVHLFEEKQAGVSFNPYSLTPHREQSDCSEEC